MAKLYRILLLASFLSLTSWGSDNNNDYIDIDLNKDNKELIKEDKINNNIIINIEQLSYDNYTLNNTALCYDILKKSEKYFPEDVPEKCKKCAGCLRGINVGDYEIMCLLIIANSEIPPILPKKIQDKLWWANGCLGNLLGTFGPVTLYSVLTLGGLCCTYGSGKIAGFLESPYKELVEICGNIVGWGCSIGGQHGYGRLDNRRGGQLNAGQDATNEVTKFYSNIADAMLKEFFKNFSYLKKEYFEDDYKKLTELMKKKSSKELDKLLYKINSKVKISFSELENISEKVIYIDKILKNELNESEKILKPLAEVAMVVTSTNARNALIDYIFYEIKDVSFLDNANNYVTDETLKNTMATFLFEYKKKSNN